MILRELTTIPQILTFVSELTCVHTYDIHPFIWDTNAKVDALIETLIARTGKDQVINYGEFDDDGRIKYFVSIIKKPPLAIIWLLHIKMSSRNISKPVLKAVFADLKEKGYDAVQFVSTNTSPSCKRWAKSLGGTPIAINYQIGI